MVDVQQRGFSFMCTQLSAPEAGPQAKSGQLDRQMEAAQRCNTVRRYRNDAAPFDSKRHNQINRTRSHQAKIVFSSSRGPLAPPLLGRSKNEPKGARRSRRQSGDL